MDIIRFISPCKLLLLSYSSFLSICSREKFVHTMANNSRDRCAAATSKRERHGDPDRGQAPDTERFSVRLVWQGMSRSLQGATAKIWLSRMRPNWLLDEKPRVPVLQLQPVQPRRCQHGRQRATHDHNSCGNSRWWRGVLERR